MDVITLARELGKELQKDEKYLAFHAAEKANDKDTELQEMIERFNDLRSKINVEISKPEKDNAEIDKLDEEFKTLYDTIITRPNMLTYTSTKNELDKVLNFVNQIIVGSVNGENPDEIEEAVACSGSCSGCSGCH